MPVRVWESARVRFFSLVVSQGLLCRAMPACSTVFSTAVRVRPTCRAMAVFIGYRPPTFDQVQLDDHLFLVGSQPRRTS
ncbi:hypothetical protein SAMN04489733_7307 [Amycolatopsis keratiniphila]|nr:hypothetical protein SAMN04489733_7307 [Amycolatopsis keratiniphila]